MDFRKELAKELGLGAIAENTMLDDYVKACEAIAVRYHESEVKKFRLGAVSGSLPSDDRIVAEAIQAARKVDTEVGLLPSNNDIKMFCLGAKWMRDLAQGNDR
jgi:hypothetical protein